MRQGIEFLWLIQRRKFVVFLKRFASKKRGFAPQVFHVLFDICTSLTLFIWLSTRTAFDGLQREALHTCRSRCAATAWHTLLMFAQATLAYWL
jgi:hypothetical protein